MSTTEASELEVVGSTLADWMVERQGIHAERYVNREAAFEIIGARCWLNADLLSTWSNYVIFDLRQSCAIGL